MLVKHFSSNNTFYPLGLQDEFGRTPLHWTVEEVTKEGQDIAKILVDKMTEEQLVCRDDEGYTALDLANKIANLGVGSVIKKRLDEISQTKIKLSHKTATGIDKLIDLKSKPSYADRPRYL
jgi:ankyrin repeat protein